MLYALHCILNVLLHTKGYLETMQKAGSDKGIVPSLLEDFWLQAGYLALPGKLWQP